MPPFHVASITAGPARNDNRAFVLPGYPGRLLRFVAATPVSAAVRAVS